MHLQTNPGGKQVKKDERSPSEVQRRQPQNKTIRRAYSISLSAERWQAHERIYENEKETTVLHQGLSVSHQAKKTFAESKQKRINTLFSENTCFQYKLIKWKETIFYV